MDVPAYGRGDEFEAMVGHVPPGPIERIGLRKQAQLEQAKLEWREADRLLKSKYGTASEDENNDGSEKEAQEEKDQLDKEKEEDEEKFAASRRQEAEQAVRRGR